MGVQGEESAPGPASALPLFKAGPAASPGAAKTGDDLSALGAGFLLDAEGLVVTSSHIVGEAPMVTIALRDGTKRQATVRGTDGSVDLTLLSLDAPVPEAIALTDTSRLRPGDWIALLSNPFGTGVNVTAGVLRFRAGEEGASFPRALSPFLGADLTVDRANQGGLVVDAGGRMVGMAVSTTAAGSDIGLLLPASDLRRRVAKLSGSGRPPRTWIGLWVRPLGAEEAAEVGLDPPRGLQVTRVVPAGPAHDAGIRPGDIILELAGEATSSPAALGSLAARFDADQIIPVLVWRDGRQRTLRLHPAPMPQ